MLFFVFGSLASGKTEMLRELVRRDPRLAALEVDIPAPARTKAERQLQLQRRLVDARAEIGDRDLLYAGQAPLGELLACPIATEFEGIAPCLLDCSDPVRIQRLRSRGWRNSIPEMDVLLWAAWMRACS